MHILNTLPQRLDPGATPTFAGLLAGDGTTAAPSISFSADPDTGFYRAAANQIRLALGGNGVYTFTSTGNISSTATGATLLLSDATGAIGLTAAGTAQNITLTPSTTGTVIVDRGALGGAICFQYGADTASRNWGFKLDTNAYGDFSLMRSSAKTSGLIDTSVFTVTPAGRFLLGTITDSGALLQIGTNTTTSAGGMVFGTDTFLFRTSAGRLALAHPSRPQFDLELNGVIGGSFFHSTGGVFVDAGAGYGTTFRTNGTTTALTIDSSQNATFAGYVNLPSNFGYRWTSRSGIFSPSDGVITLYNNATSDFTRLQFGGTTSSFPSLARSGVRLIARLADDSSVAELEGALVSAGAAVTVGASRIAFGGTTSATVGAAGAASPLPALPTGYIIVNVAGTNMKVPYYAN